MKKSYIMPAISVTAMETATFIAASISNKANYTIGEDQDNNLEEGDMGTVDDNDDFIMESKHHSIWDDED